MRCHSQPSLGDKASQQQVVICLACAALPDPPLHIVPSVTGMSVTSETTFMNSSLIINVEDGGLAFDLA